MQDITKNITRTLEYLHKMSWVSAKHKLYHINVCLPLYANLDTINKLVSVFFLGIQTQVSCRRVLCFVDPTICFDLLPTKVCEDKYSVTVSGFCRVYVSACCNPW